MPHNSWNLLDSRDIADHRIFRVRYDRYKFLPSGAERDFVVLDCPDWVNIIPITDDGQVVLVRQYRHGTQAVSLEVPGGVIEPNETPEHAAIRELREETGFTAERVKPMGFVFPNPAIQGNRSHTFLAECCRLSGEQQPDSFEQLDVVLRPLSEVPALIRNGEISHSLMIAAFALMQLNFQ